MCDASHTSGDDVQIPRYNFYLQSSWALLSGRLAKTFPRAMRSHTKQGMVCVLSHIQNMTLRITNLPALAVDMTARNMQEQVKRKGLPWSAVKGFDTFTPIRYGRICMRVHNTAYLIWTPANTFQNLSSTTLKTSV